MTDKTRQDSGSTHIIRYALELGLLWVDGDGRDKVREALDALDALEAKLASSGAGGVQALSAAPAQADSVLEDAARWQELRAQHEDDAAERCCVFAPNDMRECLVPVGSLPGELDAFIDAKIAARKEAENHDKT